MSSLNMILLKILKSHHFHSPLKLQNTSLPILTSQTTLPQTHEHAFKSFASFSIFQRNFSANAQLAFTDVNDERTKPYSMGSETVESTELTRKSKNNEKVKKQNKPLDVMFKEAVGITENLEFSESSDEELTEIQELKRKLRILEREVRRLKGNLKEEKNEQTPKKGETQTLQSKPTSLYSLFATEPENLRSIFVKKSGSEDKSDSSMRQKVSSSAEFKPFKGLSPEMVTLVSLLHQQGYLKNANFLSPKFLSLSSISNHYSRSFVRRAAERFGEDHEEIAKYLSRDRLTRTALFGCPSNEKRTAYAAKRLRSFYDIKEDIVCRPCKLRSSCKVVNHTIGKKVDDLNLKDVMKILTCYALDLVPPELEIPDEIKFSIGKLLNEVINLSKDHQCNPTSDNLDLGFQVN